MNVHSISSSTFASIFSSSLSISFTLNNSLSKETSLFVLLRVFLFACSSINSTNGNCRGTSREAEANCFQITDLYMDADWLYFACVRKAIREADWTYHFFHM